MATVESVRNIEQLLLKPPNAKGDEPWSWQEVRSEEVFGAARDGAFDIDYICVNGTLGELLQNSSFEKLLGSGTSSLFRGCSSYRLRSSFSATAWLFGKCAEFLFGFLLEEQDSERDEEAEDSDFEFQDASESQEPPLSRPSISELNAKLQQCPVGTNLTYRDFKQSLLTYFDDMPVVVFRFGQKMELRNCIDTLVSLLKIAYVDVALGLEVEIPGKVLLVSPVGRRLHKECYHMCLSSRAVNILIKDPKDAKELIGGCYRLCVYNTSQHIRAKTSPSLKFDIVGASSNAEVEDRMQGGLKAALAQSALSNLSVFENTVIPAIEKSKLRFEAYFNVEERSSFDRVKAELIQLATSKLKVILLYFS